jgi:hypothetical protein
MKQIIRFLIIFSAIVLCIGLIFFVSGANLGYFSANDTAQHIEPKTRDPEAIGPGDNFYRALIAATPDGSSISDKTIHERPEGALYEVIKQFVKKNDVIAQSKTKIDKGAWRFNLIPFSGDFFTGAYYIETTYWCIRLKFKPGQEKQFAYALMRLAELGYSDLLGLPNLKRGSIFTPESALEIINPQDKNGMLIPLFTNLQGISATKISVNQWYPSSDSNICKNITQN